MMHHAYYIIWYYRYLPILTAVDCFAPSLAYLLLTYFALLGISALCLPCCCCWKRLIISHHMVLIPTLKSMERILNPFSFASRRLSVIACRQRAIFCALSPSIIWRWDFWVKKIILPPPHYTPTKHSSAHGVRRISPLRYLLTTSLYLDIDK